MYQVSDAFYAESVSLAPTAHAKIELHDKSTGDLLLTLTDDESLADDGVVTSSIQDVTVKRSTGDSGKLTFGNCTAAQCDMNLLSEALSSLEGSLRQLRFDVYFGYEVASGTETKIDDDGDVYTETTYTTDYIPMGVFYASEDNTTDDYLMTSVTAYDALYDIDTGFSPVASIDSYYYRIGVPAVSTMTWKEIKSTYGSNYLTTLCKTDSMNHIDVIELADKVCRSAGLLFKSSDGNGVDWPCNGHNWLYAARPNGTKREILCQLGQLTCSNGVVDNDGLFTFCHPYSTGLSIRPEQYGAGEFTMDGDYTTKLACVKLSFSEEYKYKYKWNGKNRSGTLSRWTDSDPLVKVFPSDTDSAKLAYEGAYVIDVENPQWLSPEKLNINYTVTKPAKKTTTVGKKKKSTITVKPGVGLVSAINQDTEGRHFDADGDGVVDSDNNQGFMASCFMSGLDGWEKVMEKLWYEYQGFSCTLNGLPQLQLLDGVNIYDPMSFTVYPDLDSLSDSELYSSYSLYADASTSDDGAVTRSYYRLGSGTDPEGEEMRYYVESGDPVIDADGNIVYSKRHKCMIIEQEVKFDGSITQTISASSADYNGESVSSSDPSDSSDDDDEDGETVNQVASNEATIDDLQDDVAAMEKIKMSYSGGTLTITNDG